MIIKKLKVKRSHMHNAESISASYKKLKPIVPRGTIKEI
jgi:hypothetical protein